MTHLEAIERLRHPSPEERRAAASFLRRWHFEPRAQEAVPRLAAAIDDPDPAVAEAAAGALALIGGDTEALVGRITSLTTLGLIGPAARSATTRIVGSLPDQGAIEAVRLIGPSIEAAPALFDACRALDAEAFSHAVETIAAMGRPVAGAALERLTDANREIRRAARAVLERIAWVPDDGAHALVESFTDETLWGHPRWNADRQIQTALGWIDTTAPILREAVEHPDPRVRQTLVAALWRIDAKAAAEILERLVLDQDEDVRDAVWRGAVIACPDRAIPLLLAAWQNGSWSRVKTLSALASAFHQISSARDLAVHREAAGPDDFSRTVVVLEEALDDQDPDVRRCAARALAGRGVAHERVSEILLAGLDDRESWRSCARALARLGSPDAVSKLAERWRQETDETERLRIAAALAQFDQQHPVVATLGERAILVFCDLQPLRAARVLPGLSAGDPWVRRCAAETLLEGGHETEAVIRCALGAIETSDSPGSLYEVRGHEIDDAARAFQWEWLREQWPWFVRALDAAGASCPAGWLEHPRVAVRLNACRILRHDDRIIPVLVSCLDGFDWFGESFWTFIAAAELLAGLGDRAEPALPTLIEVLSHAPRNSLPHRFAVHIVGRIGPAAVDAVPALIEFDEPGATTDAFVRVLPEYADLQPALEVILSSPDYRSELVGLKLDDVRMYLSALRVRRRAGHSSTRA